MKGGRSWGPARFGRRIMSPAVCTVEFHVLQLAIISSRVGINPHVGTRRKTLCFESMTNCIWVQQDPDRSAGECVSRCEQHVPDLGALEPDSSG